MHKQPIETTTYSANRSLKGKPNADRPTGRGADAPLKERVETVLRHQKYKFSYY